MKVNQDTKASHFNRDDHCTNAQLYISETKVVSILVLRGENERRNNDEYY